MRKRIFGSESEYGALLQCPDGSFAAVDSTIVAGIVAQLRGPAQCDFVPNGARIYQDVGHVEGATAECISVREIVRAIRALDLFLEASLSSPFLGNRVILIRDNTDSVSDLVCFASHENYLFDGASGLLSTEAQEGFPQLNFRGWFVDLMATHLVTRTIFTGAGILSVRKGERGKFFLSHRAKFIGQLTSNSATAPPVRPLILTRNEPLGRGPEGNYQRVQITSGDPNISDVANYLKFGTTALIFRLAEEVGSSAVSPGAFLLDDPLASLKVVNADLSCRGMISCHDGTLRSAADIQEMLLEAVARHFPKDDDPPEVAAETQEILRRWGDVLSGLRRDPMSLTALLDWPMKKLLIESELAVTHGIESLDDIRRVPSHAREKLLDIAKTVEQRYHEVSGESYARMLRARGLQEKLVSDEDAIEVMCEPAGANDPMLRTRAWIRGALIHWLVAHRHYGKFSADWEHVNIKEGVLPWGEQSILLGDPFAWDVKKALRVINLP